MTERADNIQVSGKVFDILCYDRPEGKRPAEVFLKSLFKKGYPYKKIVKLAELFELVASGETRNPNWFKQLQDNIYEFKLGQLRLLCFKSGRRLFLTHGFIKKCAKCPRTEINKALEMEKDHYRRK